MTMDSFSRKQADILDLGNKPGVGDVLVFTSGTLFRDKLEVYGEPAEVLKVVRREPDQWVLRVIYHGALNPVPLDEFCGDEEWMRIACGCPCS